jgi:HK97 family phage portal protein
MSKRRKNRNRPELVTRANPAGEGNYHPGPYTVSGGILPAEYGQYLNYWQMDLDPVGQPSASIVEACVWAYVRAIAQLPGYHRLELDNGGTETITTSALARLLRSPNGYQTPSDFLVHLIRSLLLRGNSYWIAQRNDRQEATALHWTDPRQCQVREFRIEGQPFAEVFYEIGPNPLWAGDSLVRGSQNLIVPARDVFHVKLATPRHPLVGDTWLTALGGELAQTAAINQSLTQAASNMRPAGVIQTDLVLTLAQINEAKEIWRQQSARLAAGEVPILTRGLKFQPLTMSAQDQQIIEQRKLNDRMVAAVFGVPPILLGMSDAGTQKSSEAVMAEWLAGALGWLINHIEVAFDKFVGLNEGSIGAGREYTELDTRMLLRSAFKDRIEGLSAGVLAGIFDPNYARRLEGLPEAEDGDEPRMQQQMVPLSAWDKVPPAPPSLPPPAPPATAADPGLADKMAHLEARLDRAIDRIDDYGNVIRMPGPPGERGQAGEPGAPGERGEQGPPGEPAYGGRACGLWNQSVAYRAMDVVAFNGSEWRAVVDNPGPLPGDGWMLGAKGSRGDKGQKGERGERGMPGTGVEDILIDAGVLVVKLTDGTKREFAVEVAA